jgi:hypothetical protein
MKIFLTDQKRNFKKHLDEFTTVSVMPYAKKKLAEKTTSVKIETGKEVQELDLDFLFNYKIFPPNILSYFTQWQTEGRQMRVGDTVVQQIYLPPIRKLSQKIIVGVRISEVIDEQFRKGFSYETLHGHVEKGVSSFVLEQRGNELYFSIRTFSEPANVLAKVLGPVFSVPYQAYCTSAALKNVKRQVEQQGG